MIKVRISDEALQDLADGFWFYEAQEPGLGDTLPVASRAISKASKSPAASTAKPTRITSVC